MSRINQNKMELRRMRMALAEAVSIAAEYGHELIVSLPGPPIFLDADLTRLAQVFGIF